jgi:hypothetical protein
MRMRMLLGSLEGSRIRQRSARRGGAHCVVVAAMRIGSRFFMAMRNRILPGRQTPIAR